MNKSIRLICILALVSAAAAHAENWPSRLIRATIPFGAGSAADVVPRLVFDRLSDIRVAIYGPAALTALARRAGELHHALSKKSFYAVHAEPKLFFEPSDFSALLGDPEIMGFHVSPKGRGNQRPVPGSLYAWAAERYT